MFSSKIIQVQCVCVDNQIIKFRFGKRDIFRKLVNKFCSVVSGYVMARLMNTP